MNGVLRKIQRDRPTTSTGIMMSPNLTKKTPVTETNITAEIAEKVTEFTKTQPQKPTANEKNMIDQFWDKKIFSPQLIDPTGVFHTKIAEYPAALWTLEKLKRKKRESQNFTTKTSEKRARQN